MKRADLRPVGRIIRSHGAGGELKFRPDAEFSPEAGRVVYLEEQGGMVSYEVESVRLERGSRYLKLKGIDDLRAAEALSGREIHVSLDCLKSPGRDLFFTGQLVGCRVVTLSGVELGRVTAVVAVGESGLLVVEGGGRETMIPLAAAICREVKPEERLIRVDPPDGLLDLDEI